MRRDSRIAGRAKRGFTMMEAMIALVLMMIGMLGMGALAGAAVKSNMEAQDRTVATNLAEKMLGMMRTESMGWNSGTWNPSRDSSNPGLFMPFLSLLPPGVANGSTGFTEATQRLGPVSAFSRDLDLVAPTNGLAKYCVHYNLTWLQPNETIRADIRVYWMRRGADPTAFGFYNNCGRGNVLDMAKNTAHVRCVARSVLLSRNSSARGAQ